MPVWLLVREALGVLVALAVWLAERVPVPDDVSVTVALLVLVPVLLPVEVLEGVRLSVRVGLQKSIYIGKTGLKRNNKTADKRKRRHHQ